MNKAVVVMDMPEKCHDTDGRILCPLAWNIMFCAKNSPKGLDITRGEIEDIILKQGKPDWCPLKPIPEEKPENHTGDYDDTINEGWNKFRDYILGDKS